MVRGTVFMKMQFFAPQSLFKLPTVIAYFKIAEENPDILQQTIEYQGQILQTCLIVNNSHQALPILLNF